ncbi:MAG: CRISPR-associated endonuclease Cas2 [Bacteroidales bacterium]
MLVISYDIQDNKLRTRFAKMLIKNGAIRLQFSVYEMNNTQRLMDNIRVKIETVFATQFSGADSVIIFDVNNNSVVKYGNAIHRDKDIVYF